MVLTINKTVMGSNSGWAINVSGDATAQSMPTTYLGIARRQYSANHNCSLAAYFLVNYQYFVTIRVIVLLSLQHTERVILRRGLWKRVIANTLIVEMVIYRS